MSSKKIVLFFSPYQAVWQHSFPERKLADILEKSGDFEIKFLGCQGLLKKHCVSMTANGMNSLVDNKKKEQICSTCKNICNKTWKTKNKNFIDEFINQSEKDSVKKIISSLSINNISNFSFNNIPIGLIAPYELLLNHKLSSFNNITKAAWSDYLSAVENCIYVAIALKKFLKENIVDRIVVYNANYGTNHTVKLVANEINIPTIHFHYSLEFAKCGDFFYLTTEMPPYFLRSRKYFFENNIDNLNLQYSQTNRIFDHIKLLFNSTNLWVYSEKRAGKLDTVKETLQIKESDSVALMSLSSMDELFGLEYSVANQKYMETSNSLFNDQFKWLDFTIAFFSKHPKWKLIIRIHPREFPNKRDTIVSEISNRYKEYLSKLPPNVIVNHPDQKISIHDIMPLIKLHLTSWSSVGLESAIIGIPTISVTQNLSLYSNYYVTLCPESFEEYNALISKYLEAPIIRSFENFTKARDWLLYDFIQTTFEMPQNEGLKQSPLLFKRLLYRIGLINFDSYYSYDVYSKKANVSEDEKKIIFEFFNSLQPIFEIKNKVLKKSFPSFNDKEQLKNIGIYFD